MSKTILIIDDEIDVAKMLLYRLRAQGYTVITASDGASGIQRAYACRPDLILLDYRLPDLEGAQIATEIKKDTALAAVPIILITASVEDIKQKADRTIAVDYIKKPVDPDELATKVAMHIRP